MLSLSVPQIYQLAASREIASVKIGKSIRFNPEDVASYVASNRRERRVSNG
jgi:excisionase family DNA binding protein